MVEEHIYKLRKLLDELEKIKGRHTELVSVYIPAGFNIQEMVNMLRQEYTLTENVKNKTVRNNVLGAIDKVLQELKFFNKTPENGLVIFAGNVSEKEGETDIKVWTIQPPEPLKVKKYWCDQKFELEPMHDIVAEKELYGILVMDNKEAAIGLLKGKKLEVLRKLDSIVPGKFRKGGQCEVPETLVPLSDGNIVRIGDMKNNSIIKSADFNTFSILDSPVLDIYKKKKSTVYRVITKCPRMEVETSKDHFFFVFENNELIERPAGELKVGDTLLMPEKIDVKGEVQTLNTNHFLRFKISDEGRNLLIQRRKELGLSQEKIANKLNVFQAEISAVELGKRNIDLSRRQSNLIQRMCKELSIDYNDFRNKFIVVNEKITLPEILDEELAQVIGYFLGDGNYDKNRICFSESDKDLAMYYENKLKKLFNVKLRTRYRSSKKYYEIRICNKVLEKYFRKEIVKDKNTLNVMVPEKILKSKNNVVASFLKGFFDAEGYVSKGLVGFGINNKILARQIQLMFLRFGIITSLSVYDNKKNPYSKNYRYTLKTSEKESIERFIKNIGFSLRRKEIALERLIASKSNTSRVRQILINGRVVRKIIENHGLNKHDFYQASDFLLGKKNISKGIFERRFLDKINDEELYLELKNVLDCPIIPVRIKKIEKYEKSTPMIDLAVKHESFISNGILVHNSSGRFQRVREGLINDWCKIIAENVKELFSKFELKGIIIGGPGPAKNDFYDEDYLQTEMKKRVLGIKNVGYTDEQGLEEVIERSQDLLAEAAVSKEKALVQKFLEELRKESGTVVYGKDNVLKALEMGAVEIILISEGFETEFFSEKAKEYGTQVEVISRDTREGEQLFQIGGIAAILRWKIS